MLGAILLSGVPSVGWAVGIWVVRECIGGPVSGWMLRRAAAIGWRDQLRGSAVPLVAALAMFAAVWGARAALPPGFAALERLLLLVPLALGVYALVVWLLDRALLASLFGFARDALRRARPVEPELA